MRAGMVPPTSRGGSGSAPEAVVAPAERGQQLILRQARGGGRGRKLVIQLDPIALGQSGRGVDDNGGEVHRDSSGHRKLRAAGERAAAAGEAAQIAVGI